MSRIIQSELNFQSFRIKLRIIILYSVGRYARTINCIALSSFVQRKKILEFLNDTTNLILFTWLLKARGLRLLRGVDLPHEMSKGHKISNSLLNSILLEDYVHEYGISFLEILTNFQ